MDSLIVLLSSYNGAAYIEKQIESLLNQTFAPNMRIIVRDDGSTDHTTLPILRQYQSNGKIELWERENIGVVKSFFDLLLHAPDADYYAFCDQDDYWLPPKMEMAVHKLSCIKEPALYCSKKIIVDQTLKKLPRKDNTPLFGTLDVLMKGNIASGCTMVFNQELRNLCRKFIPDENEYQYLYHDTWLFTLAKFTGTIVYDSNSYILYRQHGKNVVGAMAWGMDLFIQRIKTFDWTFKKYRNRMKATYYAKILAQYFLPDIRPELKNTVIAVSHARNSFGSRLTLFFAGGFTHTPFYEYVIYKAYILLGWL